MTVAWSMARWAAPWLLLLALILLVMVGMFNPTPSGEHIGSWRWLGRSA